MTDADSMTVVMLTVAAVETRPAWWLMIRLGWDQSWNLVKVTRRGFGVANENVTINPDEKGFGLTIK